MSRAYASTIFEAPVEAVWALLRDFNGMPAWNPSVTRSMIEYGVEADVVGCVRAFHLTDGTLVRERLLTLDDRNYTMVYNFETPCFPVENYIARITLMPVTNGDHTFAEWEATFDEATEDKGKYEEIISRDVFQSNWDAVKTKLPALAKPVGAQRWKGFQPNKVWCSSVIDAEVDRVWALMRDFAGMGGWHDAISRMHMLDGARPDKVSGVRDFCFGEDHLREELLHLCDRTRSFSYRITESPMPWMHYVSGPRLYEVTDGKKTFGVWTGDWVASAVDDVTLIPRIHAEVYQKAFDTVGRLLAAP